MNSTLPPTGMPEVTPVWPAESPVVEPISSDLRTTLLPPALTFDVPPASVSFPMEG